MSQVCVRCTSVLHKLSPTRMVGRLPLCHTVTGRVLPVTYSSLSSGHKPCQFVGGRRTVHSSGLISSRAPQLRGDLKNSKRVVVKLGSAVITREDECGIALGRLASIVEQVSMLQHRGHQMLIVTSGAVAFGKQKLQQEIMMSMSVRQTLSAREISQKGIDPRACAAGGQSGLMTLYENLFIQYGVRIAQILVTKPDFYNEHSRQNLTSTINELLKLNIIPIINTNDAVAPPPEADVDLAGIISIKDNDTLAARLAVEVGANLMLLMSDVNGLYTSPPGTEGSRLMHTYCPKVNNVNVVYGTKSRVGLGGMESKVSAATWAVEHDVSVVIANGFQDRAIQSVMDGKKMGTFFTNTPSSATPVELQALSAREGGRALQALPPEDREAIINSLANSLIEHQSEILAENQKDLDEARSAGLAAPLIARLVLSPNKLKSLAGGLRQIAVASRDNVGRTLRHTKLAEGLVLKQITVPIGVLLVIFEARPDALPQVAALAISTGNGLLLKGGKEASHSNHILHQLVGDALEPYVPRDAVALVSRREDIDDLLQLDDYIDLVIPRGSNELVRLIQNNSKAIPVLGHSEGICHVYVDEHADPEMAMKIVQDSKCDYPAACNAMETLLVHRSHMKTELMDKLMDMFRENNVKIYGGPRLMSQLKFAPPPAKSMKIEYGSLECAIEVVDNVEEAVHHIHKYGSSHTDSIVTDNEENAKQFLQSVDSACVFHNASTRFADGYRFGLGAEVGISTTRIHARGPVGMEGLLTSKWVLEGSGDTAVEYSDTGTKTFSHEPL